MQTPGQKWFRRRSKLTDFFGLKRNLVILLIAIFVIGAGEELWMRFVPKYLQALGATVFVIGLYDALRTLLGAIYAYPGGLLADRWGHRHDQLETVRCCAVRYRAARRQRLRCHCGSETKRSCESRGDIGLCSE